MEEEAGVRRIRSGSAVGPSSSGHEENQRVALLPLMTPRETQEVSGEEEGSNVLQQVKEVERNETVEQGTQV